MKKVKVTISKDGEHILYETEGISGQACTDLHRILAEGSGEIEEQKVTAEYYQNQIPESQSIGVNNE